MSQKKHVEKVFVGLSGGVDSAVSAALLKKDGYEVTGVFIKAWTPFDYAQGKSSRYECTWKDDRRSAMRAAAVLNIPFVTLDLENEYKEGVVDYMIEEYRSGRTPNPDVMCNKEIKFGAFLKWAIEHGADYVATGHYAQKKELGSMNYELWEGKDKNKDQSYFLWTLTQDQLKHILFPVGHLQKEEVRKLAKKFGLSQAERKDSQGLCFLGQVDMKEFLSRYIPHKPGKVLNENGEIIGSHNGAAFFTIGERHGFTVSKKTSNDKPLYVATKNLGKNVIVVTQNPRSKDQSPKIGLEKVNWISKVNKKNLFCRLRYRQTKINCKIVGNNVELGPDQYISPGQSLVFYDKESCLGGGIVR